MKKLLNKIRSSHFFIRLIALILIAVILCLAFFFLGRSVGKKIEQQVTLMVDNDSGWNKPSYVSYEPIVKNEYSRPGTYLTAAQNRSYFNGLAISGETWASSHFLIGLEGEVLQLIPLDEIAYCSNDRNADTISIECCHPEADGKFTDETYGSLVTLVSDLCREYGLDPLKDIIRHYDITGKMCPLYYVEHENEWKAFLTDVAAEMTK